MKNIKRTLAMLLVVAVILFPIAGLADSGFDSSYDSGGSSDSGSSWSSSDYGSSSSSSSSSAEGDLLSFILVVVIFAIVISAAAKNNGGSSDSTELKVLNEQYSKLPDSDKELINACFVLYVDIQNAWMNFEYDDLQKYVTDELYNSYKMELETLSMKGQKNIMSNYHFIAGDILSRTKDETGTETVEIELAVSLHDYIADSEGKAVRGNPNVTITNIYRITLVKQDDKISFCPSCGAKLDGNKAHNECQYCNSVIVSNTTSYVMSKKERMR